MAQEKLVKWLKLKRRNTLVSSLLFSLLAFVGGVVVFALTLVPIFLISQILILSAVPGARMTVAWGVVAACFVGLAGFVDAVRTSTSRDDMSLIPIWLLREYLHAGPRVVMESARQCSRATRLFRLRADPFVEVLAYLASKNAAVSKQELMQAFPSLEWLKLVAQLRLFDGVLLFGRDVARVSLTVPLRFELRALLISGRTDEVPEQEAVSVDEPEKLSASEILGVPEGASVVDIKAAYRMRIKECHPDRFSSTDENSMRLAEEWTKALNAAYEALLEPRSRK